MKAFEALPEGYKELYTLDLQKDKKIELIVNLLAMAIALLLAVPMLFLVPLSATFDVSGETGGDAIKWVAIVILVIAYMVLHELVHGAAMKLCGTKKVTYGFTGLYAFAGSGDYYDKRAYLFIALAPVVLWGLVLAIITPLVSAEWFWIVYIVQIVNLAGAAGDFFVTAKFSRLPADVLIKDHGVGMTVYAKQENGI